MEDPVSLAQPVGGTHAMPPGEEPEDLGTDTAQHYGDGGSEEEDQARLVFGTKAVAVSSNKPLTSKFRGVCWNRKNKRWQAAINS
eukprot:CAMPEP_0202884360 /NCGR_PEP_ID=MMETSP1391-20130828/40848_1 /ASSEMBLY_ACC=CAM_ASM_000867 /TAXON_ID=1034604 /ORGANISM="Chlamydomonas leiostraca, Strain SAG 11-49" /LENGTH=84 /DNA_ID=CAMNT_0049567533 /DNA_START=136 /DNA_END=387 /DNA_ORIENTATION=+